MGFAVVMVGTGDCGGGVCGRGGGGGAKSG